MKFLVLILFFTTSTFAAEWEQCSEDVQSFCPDSSSRQDEITCLVKIRNQLSDPCREELRRLNQIVKDTGARGGGVSSIGGGFMGGPGLFPPEKTIFSLEGTSAFEGRPSVIQQGKATLTSPVWKKQGKNLAASLTAGTVKINESVFAPEGDRIKELHRIEAGLQYSQFTAEKKFYGLRGSLGSAGDSPFLSAREMTFMLNGFYLPKAEGDSQWLYMFFLSNNNPLINYVPIPGVIYIYKRDKFTGMIGVPLMSLQYTPGEKWIVSLSYFITNFKTAVAFILSDKHQASLNFSINQQTFLRTGREENTDRLFLNDKRIYAGWRSVFSEGLSAELQAGSSFDRALKEGRSFNDTEWERDLGRSLFVSTALTIAF